MLGATWKQWLFRSIGLMAVVVALLPYWRDMRAHDRLVKEMPVWSQAKNADAALKQFQTTLSLFVQPINEEWSVDKTRDGGYRISGTYIMRFKVPMFSGVFVDFEFDAGTEDPSMNFLIKLRHGGKVSPLVPEWKVSESTN